MAEHDILPSNSNKLKELRDRQMADRPHAKTIAKLDIPEKPKEGAGKRFIRLFLAEDVDDVGDYLVKDLIIPGVKDVFFNFLWALFWGDRRAGSRSDRISYDKKFKSSDSSRIRDIGSSRRDKDDRKPEFDINNLTHNSKTKLEEIMREMQIYLDNYPDKGVPLAYLKECFGLTGDFTDEYIGWSNLDTMRIRPTSGGKWRLILPNPERL